MYTSALREPPHDAKYKPILSTNLAQMPRHATRVPTHVLHRYAHRQNAHNSRVTSDLSLTSTLSRASLSTTGRYKRLATLSLCVCEHATVWCIRQNHTHTPQPLRAHTHAPLTGTQRGRSGQARWCAVCNAYVTHMRFTQATRTQRARNAHGTRRLNSLKSLNSLNSLNCNKPLQCSCLCSSSAPAEYTQEVAAEDGYHASASEARPLSPV